ncbi:MAG: MBL fold metallo-hydrolase [Gemmatimonadetes bacterium]|nr:MBL fold metallo-hydrolase [Gemmatimonadota bacterium]
MRRSGLSASVLTIAALALSLLAGRTTAPARAFTFNKIQDDIYQAVGTGDMAVGANAAIIVNEADVLVVDSHISPSAANALLAELRTITPKPVRYVVNTHFHFDHAHGNQVFPRDVEIIGHEFTREMLSAGKSKVGRTYDRFIGTLPAQVAALTRQIDSATVPRIRDSLMARRTFLQDEVTATNAVVPTPPNVTLSQRMTLFRGGREIELLYLGHGHTAGDIVVYLPRERVLVAGDLLLPGLPFMGDGFLNEWAETLEKLKPLAFDVVLPGHGAAFRDRERIDFQQAYLRDLWAKAGAMHARGVTAEDAARQIDMRSHAAHYPAIRAPGARPAPVT